MNCQNFKHHIDDTEARHEEDLDAFARRHLAACGACQTYFAAHAKLRHLLGNLDIVPAPPDFDARLTARLASDQSENRTAYTFFDSFKFTPSLASVALSVTFVVFLGVVLIVNLRQTNTGEFRATVNETIETSRTRNNPNADSTALTTAPDATTGVVKPAFVASNTNASNRKRTSSARRKAATRDRRRVMPERLISSGTAVQASRASDITRVGNVEAGAANNVSSNDGESESVRVKSKLDEALGTFGIYAEDTAAQPIEQRVLRVTRVRAESVGSQSDIQVGDHIEAVNDIPVANFKDADLEPETASKSLRLNLRRDTRRLKVHLKSNE